MDVLKRALGSRTNDAAICDAGAPAALVNALANNLAAQAAVVNTICAAIAKKPAAFPRDVSDRWRALKRLYGIDPARGAAHALAPSLRVGVDRFEASFAASREKRGGAVRVETAAAKRSRRKRANRRSRKASGAHIHRYACLVPAAIDRVSSPTVEFRSVTWSFLCETWQNNGVALAPGSRVAIDSKGAACLANAIRLLADGRMERGSIHERKPICVSTIEAPHHCILDKVADEIETALSYELRGLYRAFCEFAVDDLLHSLLCGGNLQLQHRAGCQEEVAARLALFVGRRRQFNL
jgi:hypothetical protein